MKKYVLVLYGDGNPIWFSKFQWYLRQLSLGDNGFGTKRETRRQWMTPTTYWLGKSAIGANEECSRTVPFCLSMVLGFRRTRSAYVSTEKVPLDQDESVLLRLVQVLVPFQFPNLQISLENWFGSKMAAYTNLFQMSHPVYSYLVQICPYHKLYWNLQTRKTPLFRFQSKLYFEDHVTVFDRFSTVASSLKMHS